MPSQDLLPRLHSETTVPTQAEAPAANSSTLPSPRRPSLIATGQEAATLSVTVRDDNGPTVKTEPDLFVLGSAALFDQTIATQAPASVAASMTSAESARVMACLKLLDEEVIAEATNIDHILAYVGLFCLMTSSSLNHVCTLGCVMCLLRWRPLCLLLKTVPRSRGICRLASRLPPGVCSRLAPLKDS